MTTLLRTMVVLLFALLAGPGFAGNASAQQLPRAGIEWPLRRTVVPMGADFWIDRLRFEVSLVRFGVPVDEIVRQFDPGADHPAPDALRGPVLVRRHDGGALLSWWQGATLFSLQLRPDPDEAGTHASAGLLIVSRGHPSEKSEGNTHPAPCSHVNSAMVEQASTLRTVGSRDGDRMNCILIAKMDQPPRVAAQMIADHLKRNGYSSLGVPGVLTDRQLIQHFQKDQARLSVGTHARADHSLLVIQFISNPGVHELAPHAQR